ncbi:MAG: hypothetical protein ACI37S_01175 [Candidatus Gastranaerophilaceae bacterium]
MEPLKEKGIPVEKQNRSWSKIVQKAFNKTDVDCYTRTRQILMNGIEVEAWNFKHAFARMCPDLEASKMIANIRRIEDSQQTTINWLAPSDQSVLETTLGYEQVAVDLTAWLAQNEPDEYVKETFDFGLLEDFDHLYRYSQWYSMEEGKCPNHILQGNTDVTIGRPTQHHHNDNTLRLRKHYDKLTATPQTKVNILTVLSGEQQTHNYYAEHGFAYGNNVLRKTYAEIKDVEEEHVTMYESLIDPTESLYEKLLIHEFTEVCNYYTCYEDEVCDEIKKIWELFLDFELGHLQAAIKMFEKYEKRDAQEVIGNKIIIPCRFKSQKEYVAKILESEADKRLDEDYKFTIVDNLPQNWKSYKFQNEMSKDGSPSEQTIRISQISGDRDIVLTGNELEGKEWEILEKGLQKQSLAPDTLGSDEYRELMMN